MENASKALIMAGGVLLGIMVLTLMVFLFTTFGQFSKGQNDAIYEKTVSEFNEQFLTYENRSDITAQDIITIANLAQNSNEYYATTETKKNAYYIKVTCEGSTIPITNETKNQFIQTNGDKTYTCKIALSTQTGRVNKVEFFQN